MSFCTSAQNIPKIELEAYKRIDAPARNEVSGIIKSQKLEGVFWVHGDSGTPDKIYAINVDGELIAGDDYRGAEVKGAGNSDWEDMAYSASGNLIIGEIGNNCECRDDLKVIVIEEPSPEDDEVDVIAEYYFSYPKRNDLLGKLMRSNYNAEAIFEFGGEIYILTKQSSKTMLFHLENPQNQQQHELTLIESMETEHYVTAADISPDQKYLAVLTYDQIMVFEPTGDQFFSSTYKTAFLENTKQIESVTFDGDDLIIAEEEGQLYRVSMSDLVEVQRSDL
ncbi:MAG: hypothetical protein JJ895_13640 [Balneolaceae bacterium]|nr:hypothetical protein [Balneolaceae bacterium]